MSPNTKAKIATPTKITASPERFLMFPKTAMFYKFLKLAKVQKSMENIKFFPHYLKFLFNKIELSNDV
ncbi:MAG: hypothetical protein STSR0006_18740 [Lentimicrobium sp.]